MAVSLSNALRLLLAQQSSLRFLHVLKVSERPLQNRTVELGSKVSLTLFGARLAIQKVILYK